MKCEKGCLPTTLLLMLPMRPSRLLVAAATEPPNLLLNCFGSVIFQPM